MGAKLPEWQKVGIVFAFFGKMCPSGFFVAKATQLTPACFEVRVPAKASTPIHTRTKTLPGVFFFKPVNAKPIRRKPQVRLKNNI